MKGRLEVPAPEIDYQLIWFVVAARIDPQRKGAVRRWAEESDRRDADLMLKLTKLSGMGPGLIGWHIISATCKLPYADIEAIVSEWIG